MKISYGIICFFILMVVGVFITESFSKSGEEPNDAFLAAIYEKDFIRMEKLLKNGVDINAPIREGLSPLAEAAFLGDPEVVNFLLSKGASVEGTRYLPNSPMYFAIIGNNRGVVERFLNLGISPQYAWPDGGGTLLTAAVDSGHLDIVELLIQRGADVNSSGKGNYSPLYRAIFSDFYQICKLLLGTGACLSERDKVVLSEMGWDRLKENKKYINLLEKGRRCKKGK